jgi:hypothetical protein
MPRKFLIEGNVNNGAVKMGCSILMKILNFFFFQQRRSAVASGKERDAITVL